MSASVCGSLNRMGQARTGPDKTEHCCFKCCDPRSLTEQPSVQGEDRRLGGEKAKDGGRETLTVCPRAAFTTAPVL